MPWSSDDKSETGRGGNPSLESVINHMANSIVAALRKTPDEPPSPFVIPLACAVELMQSASVLW